jgi:AcrR family transcriptional regulator
MREMATRSVRPESPGTDARKPADELAPPEVAGRIIRPNGANAPGRTGATPTPGEEQPAYEPANGAADAQNGSDGRYRRLPTGAHGLGREEVERDQRERLQSAMVELIAQRGYQAVRILDLTKLAHVSRPTFYNLYKDKEELLLGAYEDIAGRTAKAVIEAFDIEGPVDKRLQAAMGRFAELAKAEPESMSLFLLGAFGAGGKALERRNRTLDAFERTIQASRDGVASEAPADLTVKVILGGIREVAAARLLEDRMDELPELTAELTAWATSYPPTMPEELKGVPVPKRRVSDEGPAPASERARRAEGRLPSGRHDLPREIVVKSQRERIVDATAAIVAEKGLAGLTIPEIASRANVSHETFYEMYPTKKDAFLGAQKVGMHQAFTIAVSAYEAHKPDWPRAVAEGLCALIVFLHSEPAHAHLSIVDTFAASPETLDIRGEILSGFAVYFRPGERPDTGIEVPPIAAEAVVGGLWQILHHYIESNCLDGLLEAAPQMVYLMLTPFVGPEEAAWVAQLPLIAGVELPQSDGAASA